MFCCVIWMWKFRNNCLIQDYLIGHVDLVVVAETLARQQQPNKSHVTPSLSTNWILNMEFVSKHATDGNWLFILLENIAFLLLLFIGHFCISNKTKQKLKSFLFCWWIQIQEKRFSGGKTWFVWQSTNRRTN